MISFAIFSSIVARMGDAAMAASQAMIQLLSLSFMQAVAISQRRHARRALHRRGRSGAAARSFRRR